MIIGEMTGTFEETIGKIAGEGGIVRKLHIHVVKNLTSAKIGQANRPFRHISPTLTLYCDIKRST